MPKLTEDQIRDVRKRRGVGEGLRVIAKAFGISTSLVSNIYRRNAGEAWPIPRRPPM